MNITNILTDLRKRDIIVRVKGNDLSVVAEKGVLTPETMAILANHKGGIMSYLRRLEQKEAGEIEVVDRGLDLPLSPGQERLWSGAQLEPASSAYVIPAAVRIYGPLQHSLLNQALNRIVDRHEVLRTVFRSEDGKLRQVILNEMAVPFSFIDLRHNSPAEQRTKLEERIRSEMNKPFDLSEGPLLRAMILQLGEQEHVAFLVLHHMVADRWSIPILVRELSVFYAASQNGTAADIPALPVQFADYAAWQHRWNDSSAQTRQVTYWEKQLADLAPLALPTDHPRQDTRSPRAGSSAFVIPSQLVERLHFLGLQQEPTVFTVLLGTFQILLSRYSGQEKIAVGTPVANRGRKETEGLIGFFANTVVLCLQVERTSTFRQLLSQIRQTVLDAFENQDLPFEELVDALQPERNLNRNPLFQVMFTLQDPSQPELHLGGIKLRPFHVENPTGKFDLTLALSLAEECGELQGWMNYNAELFEPSTIDRMIGHYRTLLQRIVEEPERPVAELSLFTEAELSQLLKWNQTAADYPQKFVHELFEEHAAETPAVLAVDFEDQQLTYEWLNRRANQLGRYLKKLGAGPDVRVGICMERSVDLVVGLLAILKAGAAFVPLDPEYPADRLVFMAEEAKVPVILTQEKFAAGLLNCTAMLVKVEEEWKKISQESTDNLNIVVASENLAYVIYTSGSTGRPKGAMNTHQSLRNRILWMQENGHLSVDDRVLQKTPYSFDVSVWEFFWPLMAGAALIVARPGGHRDPEYLGTLIRQKKVSILHFVPSMLAAFLDAGAARQCESVRQVICSGEALSPELARRCMEEMTAELHNLYGPTEASIDVTSYHCTADDIKNGMPIGKPIANTEIHILDSFGHPVPVLVAGELYIGGVGLARGYVDRPDLTAERFVPDHVSGRSGTRLYQTGDRARWRADGNVEYLGRLDNQVKIRGHRIELGEIEEVLTQDRAVKQAVVVVREDQPGQKRLVAYVVLEQGGGELDLSRMRDYLQTRLPEYMVPGALVVLENVPLTANGKLDRKALPRPLSQRPQSSYVAPSNDVELALCAVFEEIFKISRVSIHDNFFSLGGDSILSLRAVAILKQRGIALEVRDFPECQTVQRLANRAIQRVNVVNAKLQESAAEEREMLAQNGKNIEEGVFS
jgi:amino acid adenylation domain-containing protein